MGLLRCCRPLAATTTTSRPPAVSSQNSAKFCNVLTDRITCPHLPQLGQQLERSSHRRRGLGTLGADGKTVSMSRHIPLLCRDPFFRDLERDFWGDRPAGAGGRSAGPAPVWEGSVPTKLFDQNFGGGLFPEDTNAGTSSLYHRSRRGPVHKSGVSSVNPTPEKFSVSIEVPQFTPDELKVRVSQEGQLLEVEGKHDDRTDEHGIISRHFVRKYRLPDDAMVELVTSSLSPDGVLTVETPRKLPEPPKPSEREVPILKTERKSAQ